MDLEKYIDNLEKSLEQDCIDLQVLIKNIQIKISQFIRKEINFKEIVNYLHENGIRQINQIDSTESKIIFQGENS